MSPKKKTAAQKKAEEAAKASMPTGIYDLDKILPSTGSRRGGGGTDDLDRFLREERQRQIDEIKGIQVEEIKLKAEKRVKDLRKEVDSGMGGIQGVSAQELAEITQVIGQLPEEQRPLAIQALSAFRQQSGGGQMGALAPLLMVSMLKEKPQTSMIQLVEAMRGLNEIQKGNQPNWGSGGMEGVFTVAKMLGEAKDSAYQTQIQLMRKEIEDIKPHDPLEYQKTLIDLATGLGFKPGTGEANMELEKIKMEHGTLMQKSNQEFQLLIKKMDRDDDRMIALIEVLKPAIASLSVAGASKMTGARAGVGVRQVPCPTCGYASIWITDDAPAACPQCKEQVITEAYQQKLLAQQQTQQQNPQPPLQQEERKPPAIGDIKV